MLLFLKGDRFWRKNKAEKGKRDCWEVNSVVILNRLVRKGLTDNWNIAAGDEEKSRAHV